MEITTELKGRKQKPKQNYKGDIYIPTGHDACQTPDYALDPILWFLKPSWKIWEPAAGQGYLVKALEKASLSVVAGDILQGQNFFDYQPPEWDCIVTNPPFSIKYKWLRRCCELNKPFAVLVPVETIGAAGGNSLFEEFDGLQLMLTNKRINYKMPNKGWEESSAQFPSLWFCRWLWEGSNNFRVGHVEYREQE